MYKLEIWNVEEGRYETFLDGDAKCGYCQWYTYDAAEIARKQFIEVITMPVEFRISRVKGLEE